MRLKNRPAVTKTVEIIVNTEEEEFIGYIDGPDKLRLDRQDVYSLKGNIPINETAVSMAIQLDPNAKRPPSDYGVLT